MKSNPKINGFRVKELRTLKLTLRQEKNKLEESKHEMELELQRKLDEERKKSKSKFGIQNPNASK